MTLSEQDRIRCYLLLTGWVSTDRSGLPGVQYLKLAEEDEARALLARWLRSDAPLTRQLREELAQVFEPASRDQNAPMPASDRIVRFHKRRAGANRNNLASSSIADFVHERILEGTSVTEAIAVAAEKYDRHEDTIKIFWRRHRKVFAILDKMSGIKRKKGTK